MHYYSAEIPDVIRAVGAVSDCSAACDRQMSPYDRPPKTELRAALRTYLLHLCHGGI